jgi:hypothetical protein
MISWRTPRARGWWPCWLVVAANLGCGPVELDSPWSLPDVFAALASQMQVVAAGPNSSDLADVAPDRIRAEVLPGDLVSVTALVASDVAEFDLVGTDAIWLLITGPFPYLLRDAPPACDGAGPTDEVDACIAGRGGEPSFELPRWSRIPDGSLAAWSQHGLVVSTDEARSSDACLAALVARPLGDLDGCVIARANIPYGPRWRLAELQLELDPDAEDGAWDGAPVEFLRLLPPNQAPHVESIAVGVGPEAAERTDAQALAIDDPIVVPAGQTVSVWPGIEFRDIEYLVEPGEEGEAWQVRPERLSIELYAADRGLADFSGAAEVPLRLTAPAQPGTYQTYLVVSDERGARTWGRLRFEVVAP